MEAKGVLREEGGREDNEGRVEGFLPGLMRVQYFYSCLNIN